MIGLGLSSSAFPLRSAREIAELASSRPFSGVEWADWHVPRADMDAARDTMSLTLRAGLATVAYRSSWRFSPGDDGRFDSVLRTARALQAPRIVAWAPRGPFTNDAGAAFADAARRAGDLAGKEGVTLCLEMERGSWLSGYRAAAAVIDAVDHPFVRLCWIPLPGDDFDTAMFGLDAAAGLVALLKARAWDGGMGRHRIERFGEEWTCLMEEYHGQAGDRDMTRYVLLHSVRDDSEESLDADAAALDSWIRALARMRKSRAR